RPPPPAFPTRRPSDLRQASRHRLRRRRNHRRWRALNSRRRTTIRLVERGTSTPASVVIPHACFATRLPKLSGNSRRQDKIKNERSEEHTSELQSRFDL